MLIGLNMVGQGTYWRAFYIGRHLARRGHEVTLMATSPTRRFGIKVKIQDGIKVVEMPDMLPGPLRSGWDPWNVINRIFWIRGKKYDLVHAFESRPTVIYPALFLTRCKDIPLIMDWADWFGKGGSVEERPNQFLRATLRPVETYFEDNFRTNANGSTVICTKLREKAITLGVSKGTILILPNGSDIERIQPGQKMNSRERVQLSKDAFIIGYVGSIFWRDAHLLAESFNLVFKRIPNAILLIIGKSKLDISKFIEYPEAVIQTGYVNDQYLNDYLASCDICWLPLSNTNANQGRFPLKINDYLAAGRPIVATAVGDIPYIFKHGDIGLLSSSEAQAFAKQTILLHDDRSAWKSMGGQARQLAETYYNWENISVKLEKFYEQVIGNKKQVHE